MHCAACVANVEEVLKELRGVKQAVVNLPAGKASGTDDLSAVSLNDMKKAVGEIGYEVIFTTTSFSIGGMTCAACVAHVEEAIAELPGVYKVAVNLALESAKVEYISELTSVPQIKKAVREAGYSATEKIEGAQAQDREREARQKEIRSQLIYLYSPRRSGLSLCWERCNPTGFSRNSYLHSE